MKITFLLLLGLLMHLGLQAQNVSITVTDEGKPMAYHTVTISYRDNILGTGKTNSNGFVSIYAPSLRSKSVDVAGKYQNGGTKREWSIKGKLKLDNRNSLRIQLEKIGEDMAKSRAAAKKRSDDMAKRMNKHSNNPNSSIFDEEEEEDNGNSTISPTTDFATAIQKIKNTRSSFDQKDLAIDLVQKQELKTSEITLILAEIKSSFSQKEIAIAAYTNCTDKNNYERVIQTLLSRFMQDDVRKATLGK